MKNYHKNTLFFFVLIFLSLTACYIENKLTTSVPNLPADGQSAGQVVLHKTLWNRDDTIDGPLGDDPAVIQIIKHERGISSEVIYFKTTTRPGTVYFKSTKGAKIYLTVYKNAIDSDSDGFPDEAELSTEQDRNAFRNWFVRIAESQFLRRTWSWNRNERDCAGLIRFAYREALRKHDSTWQKRYGIVIDKNLPDIKKYSYPDVPVIGTDIFKISGGTAGNKKSFANFADSKNLRERNTFLVSRDMAEAQKGDILFFLNEENRSYPYHTMIVAATEEQVLLLYHTGADDVIKRVSLSYLKQSKIFYPAVWNRRFLGVYRFHILE